MRISLVDAILKYGQITSGVWANEVMWCSPILVPPEILWTNAATGKRAEKVYCNHDIAAELEQAFRNVIDRGLTSEMKTFDGCYMIRDVRGEPGKPSTHSYACAIDINAATNKLGTPGDMSLALAACFIDAGFTHGRTFKRQDPMHFSLAWE